MYRIDLGEVVGYLSGEAGVAAGRPTTTWVEIVVKTDQQAEIVTAYPWWADRP